MYYEPTNCTAMIVSHGISRNHAFVHAVTQYPVSHEVNYFQISLAMCYYHGTDIKCFLMS